MPDVLDIKDPPMIVINRKYKLKLFDLIRVNPEFDKLLRMLIIKSSPLLLLNEINIKRITLKNNKYKSSLCSLARVFLSKILKTK